MYFTLFGLMASGLGYKTSKSTAGSIGFLPFLSIAVISPNYAALVCVTVSIAGNEIISRRPTIKAVFNVAQYVLAEAFAIGVYLALDGTPLMEWPDTPFALLAFILAVTTWMTVNKLAVSIVVSAVHAEKVREHWLQSMRMSLTNDLLAIPLIFFFAAAYVRFGEIVSTALALPLIGVRQLYKTNISLQRINEELLQLMVATVDAQDPYTSGHSVRVSEYSRFIARIAGLSRSEINRVVQAALLHDIGKIHFEFAPILRKPERLTTNEFEIMKTHSKKSADLAEKVTHFADLVPIVLSHHEAWDGSGYPNGKAATEIPIGARIIALADTIDAMSTSRPYRSSVPTRAVMQEITEKMGTQFDPDICRRLLVRWDEMEAFIRRMKETYPVRNEAGVTPESAQLVA